MELYAGTNTYAVFLLAGWLYWVLYCFSVCIEAPGPQTHVIAAAFITPALTQLT